MAVLMKAFTISLLTAAMLASVAISAEAAGKKILIPAPPPVGGAAPAPAPAAKPADDAKPAAPEFIGVSKQFTHTARVSKVQNYTDDITLQPGQEKLQLRMVVNNGVDGGAPGFQWFRVKANGEVLFTEAALKGKKSGALDVTGALPVGTNQIIVEAAGVPGSTFVWQLATPPMKVVSMDPKTVSPGETITLKGTNFPTDVQQANVVFGDAVGDVLSTNATTMKIKVPETMKAGTATMNISVNGLPPISVPLELSGSAAPVVSGVDMWAAPVGTTIKVSGKFFNPVPGQNQVYFGSVNGQIVSGSKGVLSVVVPTIPGNGGSVPITVVSNGKRSKNSIAFQIGRRATDPNYVQEVRQEVKVGSGVTTQNSSQASLQSSSAATEHGESQAAVNGLNQGETQSSSQSGGFDIVSPGDKW